MATDLQPHLETLAHSPGEAAALAAVEASYRAEARWEELLRVVEDNAQRVEPGAAVVLWRKAATVCLSELNSGPRAEAYLQRALEAAPGDVDALKGLRQILIGRGDLEQGVEVWEKELARTTDAKAKASGLVEVAGIYRAKLGRDDKALSTLRQAQRVQAKDPAINRGLAAIYDAQGRLDQAQVALLAELENGGVNDDVLGRLSALAERLLNRPKLHELARGAVDAVLRARPHDGRALAMKRELDAYKSAWSLKVADLVQRAMEHARSDPAQAADAWLTLAEIQLVYGEQPEAALGSLDKAVAARPGHSGALRLLEEIYGGQERFDELALKLEMMAGYAREPAAAVEIYLKAALLYAVRLDNPDAASKIHLRVLALDPGNKVSSNALAEHYRERKHWDQALAVLRAWADKATQATDKVAAHYACCRIYEEELADRNAARPHYEAILALDPENQAAARALEDVYRAARAHAQLARVLKAKLAGLRGNDRVTVLSELGELLAGPVGEPSGALKALGELYQLLPDAKLRERLEELAAMAGAFADLVQILEGGLERIQDNADRLQAMHSIAALYEGARDAPLEALRIHRRILALAPKDARAKESVERLMQSAAQTGNKIAFYREQAEAAGSDSERVSLLHSLAKELVETAKDYVRATDVYRQILKVAPRDGGAIEGLLALYRRDNRWAEVADVLLVKIEGMSGAARLPVALELARIMEQRLAQVDGAVEWFREGLNVSPGHTEARTGLERLLARAKHVVQIAEVLQPYYLKDQRWDQAAAMLEIRIKGAGDATARAKLLRELAALYEKHLHKPHEALAALLRAFQADPADHALARDSERLASATGDFSGVVRAYRAAGVTLEGEERNRMFLRAGALAEKSGDLVGSVVDYLRVLGLSDDGDKTSLDGLRRVLRSGLPPERFRDAARHVAAGMEDAQLASYWRELAQFFERDMQSANDAIAAWKEVLKLHTGDPQATGELDRLYATTTDPRQLVEHLRGKMDATDDDTVRAALGGQIGEILADRLGDVNGAIAELTKVGERLPGKPMVWRRLADLYLRTAQPQEAAQCLHRELGLLPEGDERHGRLVAYADLLANKLGDVATAVAALQGVTTAAPAHAEAIAVLQRMQAVATDAGTAATVRQMLGAGLSAGGRFKEAAALLATQIEATADSGQRVALLRQLAKIKAERLSDARGAYADLERAFRDTPLDPDLRAELERLAETAQAWPQLAEAYRAALGVVSDAGAQKALQRKLAELLDKKLGRGAEAIEHYRAATGGQLPDDISSLEAMERLLRAQNRQPELVEVLAAIANKLPPADKARRQMILLEVAALAETALGDKDSAVETYKVLADLDAKDMRALRKLEHLLGELGRVEERTAVLEKLVALGAANPEAVEDLLKLAQTCVQRSMAADAVKHFRAVLLKKREHPAALAGLEQLMAQVDNKLEIAQILEPIYTAKQDHEKLAWVLEARLDATADKAQRKGLLRRIGDIFENRLSQREHAFVLARRSLHEDPADMGVRMWIEKLAGETGLLADLAQAYSEEAAGAEPQLALQFHRRAAALYHEKLNDAPAALTAYKAILAVDARDEKALAGMEAILRGSAQAGDLVDLLRQRVGATAGVERKREYLNEIATLQVQQLKDFGAAVQTYQEILTITPDDINAFGQIEQLLAQTGSWEALAQVYERELARLADKKNRDAVARRLEYTYRRGRVLDEQFAEREQAAKLFEQVLAESPAHASTVTYLGERAKQGVLEAMNILEKVHASAGQWQKYVELMQLKLNHTPESERRRPIFLALAQVFDERLKVGDMAFRALALAYRENRTDLELIERLEEMAGRYGQWTEVVALLGTDVDAVPDAATRQHHLRRLGAISGEHLKDVQRATAYLQAALQYDPRDDQALAALDALLESNKMWAALADLLERRIDLAGEPPVKSRLLERLAVVWSDHLMDPEAALRCHQQILEIDPDHPISLKSTQKLYAEVQDWDSLAKNLQRQAEVLSAPEEQVRVHAAAGQLYAEELGDNAAAIDHWLKVVAIKPGHAEASQSLEVLLSAEERWEELASHYQRMLAHTQDTTQKSDINRRLGAILSDKLGRTEDALGSWLEVLRAQPKNADALRALLKLYNERAMWKEVVEIARRAIPMVDPGEAKEMRILLAKALGENLGARDEAIKIAREVRATEPHSAEQLTRLALTLKNIEAFEEAVTTLEKAAALETDGGAKIALFYEAAEIYGSRLNKPNDAKIAYESIRAAEPTDANAYTALAEIYRGTSDWRKLVQLHEDFLPHADVSTRRQMLMEIRDVHDEKLGEKEMAFIAACRSFKENPADLANADALERLGAATEAGEELAAVMEDEVDNIADLGARIAVLRRIARIYADFLLDTNSAEATLNRILTVAPADVEALDAMAALGARDDRYDKQIAALESKLAAVSDAEQRKSVLFEVSRIWEDQIGEIDEAVRALNRVLEIDGSDKNALNGLAKLYEGEQRWAELAHTLTRKVELTQDAAENVTLRMRVGALCESELGDQEAAIEWYRGVLEFDAAHAGTLSALERLYTGQERWSELLQAFELQRNATGDKDEKVKILSKMASIYEAEFDSSKDAAACYEQIFALDNTHVASLRHLERLLRAQGEWNRLIEVVQHHITLVSEPGEITELYIEMGEIYYNDLGRVDKAEEMYNAARDFNPNSAQALHALGQLYERSGNWFQALEMLQKETEILGADPSAAAVYLRIGKINEDMLMDGAAAQAAYKKALELDPSYAPALQAMKEIARASEDWDSYVSNLVAEAESADDAEAKTELFAEAARFFQEVREDEVNAIKFYQRALEYTPGHMETARSLGEIYFRSEMWAEAGQLYDVVVQNLDKSADPKDYCQKNYRLGYICEKLGNRERALEHYREAFEADATYLPALEGLGQALLSTERWEEAQKVFQTILIHHRDSLTESEVVDVQWQLGDICGKQGQRDKAYKQFEKALEIDPDHGPSLSALAAMDREVGNWPAAYERLSRLADAVAGVERGEVLLELSDIARTQLGDINKAIEALEKARRMGQPPVEVLDLLADAYLETHQAPKAADVLEQAVSVAQDPQQISDLCLKLAQIYEGELKQEPLAVQKYNAALDAMPTNIKAFEAIERILGARQEWALLEQNYRGMIARSKDLSPQMRLVLWRNLAELYRRALGNVDEAIMAYEVIQKLDPGRAEDLAILAELYGNKPEHRSKAMEFQHEVAKKAANPVDAVRRLRKLYHAERNFDAVYAMCAALAVLKEADEEERKIFAYLQQGVPARAANRLVEDQWKLLFHPDLASPTAILANWLFRSAPELFTRPAQDLGLRKKDQVDVRASDLYFANMMRYVAKMLGIPAIDLYRKGGSAEPLVLAPSQPPALVAGEDHDVFRDSSQRSVLFHIGRTLTYARPELFLGRIYPMEELRDLLFGICVVFNQGLKHNGDPREVMRWAQAFSRVQPQNLKRLQAPARAAYQDLVAGSSIEKMAGAVEMTAARAGLVACADLGAAVQGVTEAGEGVSSLPVRFRVKELVMFAVSREYLQLRQATGSALVEGTQARG